MKVTEMCEVCGKGRTTKYCCGKCMCDSCYRSHNCKDVEKKEKVLVVPLDKSKPTVPENPEDVITPEEPSEDDLMIEALQVEEIGIMEEEPVKAPAKPKK